MIGYTIGVSYLILSVPQRRVACEGVSPRLILCYFGLLWSILLFPRHRLTALKLSDVTCDVAVNDCRRVPLHANLRSI